MRLRSRELNVFSMSALDLFASDMGAFILVTVMALPFFPNSGDSGEDIEVVQAALEDARRQRDQALRDLERAKQTSPVPDEDAEAQAEKVCRSLNEAEQRLKAAEDRLAESQRQVEGARQQLQDAEQNAEEPGDALADLKIPDLDIVICLDVSGSMEEEIEGLKRGITDLMHVLDTLAQSTGIGVVVFGDRRWRTPIHVQQIVGLSQLSIIEQFVGRLEPNMRDPRWRRNEDYPEALATALNHAAGLNWRSISRRRYIAVISDVAAYPDREQSALRTAQSFAPLLGQTVSSVRMLDPRTNPEKPYAGSGGGGQQESYRHHARRDDAGEPVSGDVGELMGGPERRGGSDRRAIASTLSPESSAP